MTGKSDKRINKIKKAAIITAGIILLHFAWIMLFQTGTFSSPNLNFPQVKRGRILDRNGRILAIQTELNAVTGGIPNLTDLEQSASLLASILEREEEELLKLLKENSESRFFYIERNLSLEKSRIIEEEIARGNLPGISLRPEYGRSYPEKELTGHITGFTGVDNTGLDGIEYKLNSILSPPVVNSADHKISGNDVYLTIDLNLQFLTAKAAREAYESNFADSVMVVAMDAKNGDVLSYVSYPSYDPNNFADYSANDRINRPVQVAYEPGSVFKIYSIASFLDQGGIEEETRFTCNGFYENAEYDIKIKCLGIHGSVNAEDILKFSCNSGTAQASDTVSEARFYSSMRNFGFGKATGLPFSGETNGIFSSPEKWSVRSKPTIAFGQEISVSAMQLVTAATVFTNKGVLLKPHIIHKITKPEGTLLKSFKREPVREVISPQSARSVLDMMEQVTKKGTGSKAHIEGLNISTKTGTAQLFDPETKTYSQDKFIATALAIFPTDNPEVIMYVYIKNPKGSSIYGGRLAAPVIKDLAYDFSDYLKITTDFSPVYHLKDDIEASNFTRETIEGSTLPDFTGYSKREVLKLLKEKGIPFQFTGNGHVVSQTPPPGSEITEDIKIILEFQ